MTNREVGPSGWPRLKSPVEVRHLLDQSGTVLLDTARVDAENDRSLLFTAPEQVIEAKTLGAVQRTLYSLDAATSQGYWVAGYLAYEAGFAFENITSASGSGLPLAWFGIYRQPYEIEAGLIDALHQEGVDEHFEVVDPVLDIDRTSYSRRIGQIKETIHNGEVYQINFTDRVNFDFAGSPWALYTTLRARQRVAYSAFLNLGAGHVLSHSPELFFRRNGRHISVRPMKGTIRRGGSPGEDAALRHALANDEKNRAENLMIVDLLRNDLSVVCEPGTVRTPELFTTEPFETLIQMTSTVEGRLRQDAGYAHILRALFPCGSVTGAPKIRAMQHIQRLENSPRGIYCGAIGYAAPDAKAVFNVAIRTTVLRNGRGTLGVGSGIVWDSDPDDEYDECLLKARFLTDLVAREDFQLIETMLCGEDGIPLFDLHRERIMASASQLGFQLDPLAFQSVIASIKPPSLPSKIRVLLDRYGKITVEATPLDPNQHVLRRVTLAEESIDSGDPLLFYKTTRRAKKEAALKKAHAAGFDEVLFLNERGEVTEGAWTNVFIEKDGRLFTPPVESGLLPGVFRRHLLATRPEIEEHVLTLADLRSADAVYLCNAVRGLVRVEEVSWGEVQPHRETSATV